MIVRQTWDKDEIRKVLCHPEIFPCISDDRSFYTDDFDPPMSVDYVAGYAEGTIVALMVYEDHGDGVLCHIQVLPEYRSKYAREFARMALNFGKAKNAILYAEIPICFPNVISFAESFGFEEYGIIKNDCIKNGIAYDSVVMRLENGIHKTINR